MLLPIARAVALFFGGFTLLCFAGEARALGFDASLWWIDLPGVPRPKLACERKGVPAFTVPAKASRAIRKTPLLVLREVPAFRLYFLCAVLAP
jgi:hypothetical protein